MAGFLENIEDHRERELAAALALISLPGVGPSRLKIWKSRYGSLAGLWEKKHIPDIQRFLNQPAQAEAEVQAIKELQFIHRFNIGFCLWGEDSYPQRLRRCTDAPFILFHKGKAPLEQEKHLAIVGTRSATEKARYFTEELIGALSVFKPLIISGLALGIDTAAHRAALKVGLDTAAVVGHGMDTLYPAANRRLAADIVGQGYLLTEFPSGTGPDKQNFPRRNRIIAGLCDALVVVETGEQGGAMITARLAHSYDREIFAVPGRPWEPQASGCNLLIKSQIAQLITCPEDLIAALEWDRLFVKEHTERTAFHINLSQEEQEIVELLQARSPLHVEELGLKCRQSPAVLASTLLGLEINGIIRALPGRQYELA
jgi:DNA processing protein